MLRVEKKLHCLLKIYELYAEYLNRQISGATQIYVIFLSSLPKLD